MTGIKFPRILALVLALCAFSGAVNAEVPQVITYQARLTDSLGEPVPDGDYTATFTIYDAANDGNVLWSFGPVTGPIEDGLFTVNFGNDVLLPHDLFSSDTSRWLGVTIDPGPEMQPRVKFTSVAYAYQALRADTAEIAMTGGGWTATGNLVYLSDLSDSVGIGTATPEEKLHVMGNLKVVGQANIGGYNSNSGDQSFVAGENNNAQGDGSTIPGGSTNLTGDDYAVVSGGYADTAEAVYSTVSGGAFNAAFGSSSTVGGGEHNRATNGYAVIGGGAHNVVMAPYATIVGGYGDTIGIGGAYSYLFGIGSKLTQDSTFMVDVPHIWIGNGGGGYSLTTTQGSEGQVLTLNGDDGAIWMDPPQGGGGGGWADDGAVVRLETAADKVGIGTSNPEFKLGLDGDGGILAAGTFGAGNLLTTTGPGTRLFWYPRKAALRAGYVESTRWDDANVGNYSTAFGYSNRAQGEASFAIGRQTSADSAGCISLGSWQSTWAEGAIAIGAFNQSWGAYGLSLGYDADVLAASPKGIALGTYVTANADKAIVIGTGQGTSNHLINDIGSSLMIGFGKITPTLFVNINSVGIGTTSPETELDVNGIARVQGDSWPMTGEGMELAYSSAEKQGYIQVYDRGTSSWGNLYLGDGKVGIGTLTPSTKLSVHSTSITAIEGNALNGYGVSGLGNIAVNGYGVIAGVRGVSNDSVGVYGRGPIAIRGDKIDYYDWAGYFDGRIRVIDSMPGFASILAEAYGNMQSALSAKNYNATYGVGVSAECTGNDGVAVKAVHNGPLGIGVHAKGGDLAIWAEGDVSVTGVTTTGILTLTGGSDLSENFDIVSDGQEATPEPGMVVRIDSENPGKLILPDQAYDRRVAGIISGAGDIETGMVMGQHGSIADGAYPVALSGRVYCRASASNGSIAPGDMLTTSELPGYAMKVTDYERAHGAVIGKAMTSLKQGEGLVLVLVSLQ